MWPIVWKTTHKTIAYKLYEFVGGDPHLRTNPRNLWFIGYWLREESEGGEWRPFQLNVYVYPSKLPWHLMVYLGKLRVLERPHFYSSLLRIFRKYCTSRNKFLNIRLNWKCSWGVVITGLKCLFFPFRVPSLPCVGSSVTTIHQSWC